MIPYGRQQVEKADIDAVAEVLASDFLTTGPEVERFEQELADYLGVKHVVAVSSGTAALHLALKVAGIGKGDRVLTSPITFLASANSAVYVEADVDFVDIEKDNITLDPAGLDEAWDESTKAVVGVDYAGNPCDWPAIAEIARKRGAVTIADSCHAVGGEIHHHDEVYKIGAHPWADITTFSFHPVKTLTTGEGGAITTNNDDYAEAARLLRQHGMVRDPGKLLGLGYDGAEEFGPWYYEMQELGYNYRITDFQCALGRSQLRRLDKFVERRREIVDRYNQAFRGLDHVELPHGRDPGNTSWHLYALQFNFAELGMSRTDLMARLKATGVGTQVHYIPVHLQPFYRNRYGFGPGKCPVAEQFYQRCLSLPLYPAMSDEDVETVIDSVKSELGY